MRAETQRARRERKNQKGSPLFSPLPHVQTKARLDFNWFGFRFEELAHITHTMKTIIISLICLLVGFGIGWQVKQRRDNHVPSEYVHTFFDATESQSCLDALIAIRAIGSIQSGDTQRAIQRLAHPIAEYYCVYPNEAGTNYERRRQTRAEIEQLVSTNKIVATELATMEENSGMVGKDARLKPLNPN
jgi:hypothetical protein